MIGLKNASFKQGNNWIGTSTYSHTVSAWMQPQGFIFCSSRYYIFKFDPPGVLIVYSFDFSVWLIQEWGCIQANMVYEKKPLNL